MYTYPKILIVSTCFVLAAVLYFVYSSRTYSSLVLPLFILSFATLLPFIFPLRFGFFLLPKIQLAFFSAPFIPLYGYLVFSDYTWGWTPEILAAINQSVNFKIASVGAMGALGFVTGIALSIRAWEKPRDEMILSRRFSRAGFLWGIIISLALSWLSAPSDDIFQGNYGGDKLYTLAVALNFPGAYLFSYAIILGLYLDAEHDLSDARRWKFRCLILEIAFIAIYLQFLRGDREILGLFIALGLLYLTRTIRYTGTDKANLCAYKKKRNRVLVICVIGVFLLLAIGVLRFTLSEGIFDLSHIFFASPWVMALLSLLAFFGTGMDNELIYGKTYVEYFLSLPPGIITNALGLVRAIEPGQNLAVDLVTTGLTSGGAHVVLPSLRNFGLPGVYFIMMIYSYLSSTLEKKALNGRSWAVILWLNVVAVVPIWFWYGEMAGIRGVMAGIIVFFLMRLSLLKRRSVSPPIE